VRSRCSGAAAIEDCDERAFAQVNARVVGLAGLEPAASSLLEIDGPALCYPAFALVVRLRKSYKDGVNSFSAAERGLTRLPDRVATQAPGFTTLAARPTAAAHRSGLSDAGVHAGVDGCWVRCWATRRHSR
jgi:hypothetical protein